MLLRYGVIAMSFSVVVTLVLAVILVIRDRPEEVVATDSAAASPEPTTEQAYQDPRDMMLDLPSPEPEPRSAQPEPASEPEPKAEPESDPKSVSQPDPASGAVSQGEPAPKTKSKTKSEPRQQSSLPVVEGDWPMPKAGEIKAANQPRSYDWVPGAIMTLTVNAMGISNAPVMGSDGQQALDNGIVHVPETSLPWTRSPHKNVYLAGHRLGWPSTGSRLIFYNLDELQSGDEIVLKDRRDRRYKYRVSDVFVVGFNDRWVMGQELNRDMVTLQTCTGPNFSKRLIVRADRV